MAIKALKGWRKLDDEAVEEVSQHVESGLSTKAACILAGVTYQHLEDAIYGERPRHPEWLLRISRARVLSEQKWLEVGTNPDPTGTQAKIAQTKERFAEFMLKAIEPERYRERQQDQAQVVVQLIQSGSSQPVKVELWDGNTGMQISQGTGPIGLPEVTVTTEVGKR